MVAHANFSELLEKEEEKEEEEKEEKKDDLLTCWLRRR